MREPETEEREREREEREREKEREERVKSEINRVERELRERGLGERGGWMDLFYIKCKNIEQIYIRYKYKVHVAEFLV